MADSVDPATPTKKRKSGVPTDNAGEYFVMGELLRRGFDAQLADRNTKGYDILVSKETDPDSLKIQIKTVRKVPWYISGISFKGMMLDRITVFVLLGDEKAEKSVRYFIAYNREIMERFHKPETWPTNGFMPFDAVKQFEDRWILLRRPK